MTGITGSKTYHPQASLFLTTNNNACGMFLSAMESRVKKGKWGPIIFTKRGLNKAEVLRREVGPRKVSSQAQFFHCY